MILNSSEKDTLARVNDPLSNRGNFFMRCHIDPQLLFGLIALMLLSLFILWSASGQNSDMMLRKCMHTFFSVVIMIVLAQVPPKYFIKVSVYAYILGIVLLVLVELFGDISKGAQRWLNLGVIRVQPSEIFKVVMPLTVAAFLSRAPLPPRTLHTVAAFAILGAPTALILLQPDLGTACLVAVSGLIAIFLAGLAWWWIVLGISGAAAALPVRWNFVLHDYQKQRVMTLLDPTSDPLGAGYHIIQSKIAIGSGGMYGKGWLHGSQSQLDFLPEPHTDFIFAVLSEETGLIGFTVLMLIYCFILWRCVIIALNAADNFGRILSGAFAFTFMFYIFVNIGMVSGILPVVGVPLPFVSYGGTAMITLSISFGIIMSIHTHVKVSMFKDNISSR